MGVGAFRSWVGGDPAVGCCDLGLWIQKSWNLPWARSSSTVTIEHARLWCSVDPEEPAWRLGSRERVGGVAHCPGQSRGPGGGYGGSAGTCTCSEHPPLSPSSCFPFLRENPDINELNLPKTCDISFSDPDDLLNFKLVICPDEVRAHSAGLPGTAGGPISSRETWFPCQALLDGIPAPLFFLHRASTRAGSLCSVLR